MNKTLALVTAAFASLVIISIGSTPVAVASDASAPPSEQALDQQEPALEVEPGVCGDAVELSDCFNCNPRDSTGSCKGADQCTSSREQCQKSGCKISGTASCSSSANVKKCS